MSTTAPAQPPTAALPPGVSIQIHQLDPWSYRTHRAAAGIAIGLVALYPAAKIATVVPLYLSALTDTSLADRLQSNIPATMALLITQPLLLLCSGLAAVIWTAGVRANTERLSYARHTLSAVWAWLGWILPIANLWIPFQVLRDIDRASDPSQTPGTEPTTTRHLPRLLAVWWASFLAMLTIDVFANPSSATPIGSAMIETVVAALAVLAAACWAGLVRRIYADQWAFAEKATRWAYDYWSPRHAPADNAPQPGRMLPAG